MTGFVRYRYSVGEEAGHILLRSCEQKELQRNKKENTSEMRGLSRLHQVLW